MYCNDCIVMYCIDVSSSRIVDPVDEDYGGRFHDHSNGLSCQDDRNDVSNDSSEHTKHGHFHLITSDDEELYIDG